MVIDVDADPCSCLPWELWRRHGQTGSDHAGYYSALPILSAWETAGYYSVLPGAGDDGGYYVDNSNSYFSEGITSAWPPTSRARRRRRLSRSTSLATPASVLPSATCCSTTRCRVQRPARDA